MEKENNNFAYLDHNYLASLSIVEQIFLIAQDFCRPFIKGEMQLPSEIESLVYTRMALSDCIRNVSSQITNYIYRKELNINLALSKDLENSSINCNDGYN